MTAAQRWSDQLAQWAIPPAIIERAPESPWGFDTEVFVRRAQVAQQRLTPSNQKALEALPEGGTVLDVGCGGGAASTPLAPKAKRMIGIDGSADMLAAFQEIVRSRGIEATVIQGRWPDVAAQTPVADVVVCHHVAYNAPDLAEFAGALTDHARGRVVLELTAVHPMSRLNDLWLHFHGLRRPTTPTVDDAIAVLEELGVHPERLDWDESTTARMLRFSTQQDLIRWLRRRLCLPAERDDEIWAVARQSVEEYQGGWSFPPMGLVTLWWTGTATLGLAH